MNPNYTRPRTDNDSWIAKVALRADVARELAPTATVLEAFAGEGAMYRQVWSPFRGATADKVTGKVEDAAKERPLWACYRGDTEKMLRAGWMGHRTWDVVDVDAYGSPWPFVLAWAKSDRLFAANTMLICTDGYMAKASLSPPCRALFGDKGPREATEHRRLTNAEHVLVKAALDDGRISSTEPCEVCGATQRVEGGRPFVIRHHWDYTLPLDTIPLCLECHQRVHTGAIPEPRTGKVLRSTAERRDVRPDDYLDLARRRVGAWIEPKGGRIDSFETIAPPKSNMRLHLLRLTFTGS
jgi:hypothetical protein